MSLNRLLLRAATVQALKGKTIAGDRVFDSRMDQLQTSELDDMLPAICVYTESDTADNQNAGSGIPVNFIRNIDLQLEVTLGSWKEISIPGPSGNPEMVKAYELGVTDAELEALLDLFELQIKLELLGVSEEAMVWQRLCRQINGWNSIPGRDNSGTNKLTARQVVIPITMNDDCRFPVDGSVIAKGTKGASIYPPLVAAAPYLKKMLEDLARIPEYQTMRVVLQQLYGTVPLPPVGRLETLGIRAKVGDADPIEAPTEITD